jgi:hypothetical protein
MLEAGANVYDGDMRKQRRAYRAMLAAATPNASAPVWRPDAELIANVLAHTWANDMSLDFPLYPAEARQLAVAVQKAFTHTDVPLFAAPPSSPSERDAALEEAIKAATAYNEEHGDPSDTLHHGNEIITAIRHLKASRSDTVGPEAGE